MAENELKLREQTALFEQKLQEAKEKSKEEIESGKGMGIDIGGVQH